jgi:AcrR family transcriptional regulator
MKITDLKKPRVMEKPARIREIQNAARKIFFENGYLSTTVDEIAKSAGVAKGTIYLYFKNKDDLYISLMTLTALDLTERTKKLEAQVRRSKFKNAQALLNAILNIFWEWYKADPDGFAICTAFQQGGLMSRMSNETLATLNDVGRKGFRLFRQIISLAKDMGLIKNDVDEVLLADLLYSLFLGLTQFEENKRRMTNKDYMYQNLKHAFSLIADGCSPLSAKIYKSRGHTMIQTPAGASSRS